MPTREERLLEESLNLTRIQALDILDAHAVHWVDMLDGLRLLGQDKALSSIYEALGDAFAEYLVHRLEFYAEQRRRENARASTIPS